MSRYSLLAFVTLGVVVVGYAFFAGSYFSDTVHDLVELQARKLARVVRDVAVTNDHVALYVDRQMQQLDDVLLDALAAQVEAARDRLRSQKEILRRWMGRLSVDRALLVDRGGTIQVDEGAPRRPGQTEPSSLERIETARIVRTASLVAAGEEAPDEPRRAYRRVGEDYCLVLLRSDAAVQQIAPENAIPRLLETFEGDPTFAYIGIRDRDGKLLGEAHGAPAEEVERIESKLSLALGEHTLRVDVNLDQSREVERRATALPLLIGFAVLLAGGVAMALVFRLQHTYLERERELRVRVEKDRRLAALGRLTAGVAHEIKNPLNAIRLSAGRLERRLGADEQPIVAAITASVASIKHTVEDFMKLAREPHPSFERGEPRAIFEEALDQVRPMAEELGRTLAVSTQDGAGETRVDGARLREALVNVLRNALQAARGRVDAQLRRESDRFVFEVDDDGPGVPRDQRREIFEFFYTTKTGGTGLGLPLAHRVAEEHGGSLEIADAPLGGARFTLTLPCL